MLVDLSVGKPAKKVNKVLLFHALHDTVRQPLYLGQFIKKLTFTEAVNQRVQLLETSSILNTVLS